MSERRLRAKRETVLNMADIEEAIADELGRHSSLSMLEAGKVAGWRADALRIIAAQMKPGAAQPLPAGQTIPSPDDVHAAESGAGGWTKAQLAMWGVSWPPPRGWRKDLERRWREQKGK